MKRPVDVVVSLSSLQPRLAQRAQKEFQIGLFFIRDRLYKMLYRELGIYPGKRDALKIL
jgi:hypothetical protein